MKAKGTYAYVHGDEPYLSYSFFVSEIEGTGQLPHPLGVRLEPNL